MKNFLLRDFLDSSKYRDIRDYIDSGEKSLAIKGISKESLPYLTYALSETRRGQMLIISEDEYKAKSLYEDLKGYGIRKLKLYPKKEMVLYDVDAFSGELLNQRNRVISSLLDEEDTIVIASAESILEKISDKVRIKSYRQELNFGENYSIDELIRRLIIQGYERTDMVEGKSQFSRRGGIVDIYPPSAQNPYRVEFFDEEVDSIRTFDIKTQRSIENLPSIDILATEEILLTEEERLDIASKIERTLEKVQKSKGRSSGFEKISKKFETQIRKLRDGASIKNIDLIVPFIDSGLSSIVDYFEDRAIILLYEADRIEESIDKYLDNYKDKVAELMDSYEVFSEHLDIFYKKQEIKKMLLSKNLLISSDINRGDRFIVPSKTVGLNIKSVANYQSNLDMLIGDINFYKRQGYKTIIASPTRESVEQLRGELFDKGVDIKLIDNIENNISRGEVAIFESEINSGLVDLDNKIALISHTDIFGVKKKKRKKFKRKDSSKISSFTDLKVGDYVVHESHGIGRYTGINQLNVEGVKKDYMIINYSGDDVLYIPIDQMDLIQRYIGSDAETPKISKLGGTEWHKTKAKVRKAVEDMAKDLIELYAKRETVRGYQFSQDTPWQVQFESAFPHQETDDQLRSIEEIKHDMESKKAMDRLLCGDVGYGKTEVALRAMFKAVMDGKQVVFLVPTTILAQQHYNNIVERFSGFPVNIESLSRFKTARQQKNIINGLKSGNIDIIVGTHKILSKSVKFKDLGLLVIDEEQRFGVKQKEKIKSIREAVDVLTLTATPIPRTLHMSLTGIRDMSLIEEPPEERHPVQTYVLEYSDQIVRDSILKEISRDGQVYFLYNKVRSIDAFSANIKNLVPEARVGVAHGQMGERNLEKVMLDFLDKEYDVLVCTTIIETGLDIPSVNTIIINDADKMGLSQLYQLRGRVGRSDKLAYAYFTYEKDKVLSEVAEKRLRSIKEFTEFGSGFKIAMRDLEIRGAGNLLGAEQHGQMAAIGYDLYVKYLEKAVKKLGGRKELAEVRAETTIELNVDGYIPDKYISSGEQKIEIYKRISVVEDLGEKYELMEELIDRYGDIPRQVDNLISISYIKHSCSRHGIRSVEQDGKEIRFSYRSVEDMKRATIEHLIGEYDQRIEIDISSTPSLKYILEDKSQETIIREVEKIVTEMNSI